MNSIPAMSRRTLSHYYSPRLRLSDEALGQPVWSEVLIDNQQESYQFYDYPNTIWGPARVVVNATQRTWKIIFESRPDVLSIWTDDDRNLATLTRRCGCTETVSMPGGTNLQRHRCALHQLDEDPDALSASVRVAHRLL